MNRKNFSVSVEFIFDGAGIASDNSERLLGLAWRSDDQWLCDGVSQRQRMKPMSFYAVVNRTRIQFRPSLARSWQVHVTEFGGSVVRIENNAGKSLDRFVCVERNFVTRESRRRFRNTLGPLNDESFQRVRICPATGPECLTASQIARKAKEIVQTSGADSVEHFEKCGAVTNGETFKQQAEWWLNHIQNRKKKPVKPATAASYHSVLKKWLNPLLGDLPLASVGNAAVKKIISNLSEAKLSPKSIVEIVAVVKLVVASAVYDEEGKEGQQRYPRTWNQDYINLREIDPKKHKRPRTEPDTVRQVILGSKDAIKCYMRCLLPVDSERAKPWVYTLKRTRRTNSIRM